MRTSATSFFIFTGRDYGGSYPSWEDVISELGVEPEEYDAKAFAVDGSSFEVTVSLIKLPGCKCCAVGQNVDGFESQPSHTICAYIRENNDRQQYFVRYLEKEMRRLHSMQSAMDASFDAFFSISPDGRILAVNEAATKIFQWTREEFIGKNISMIVGGPHADRHGDYIKHYMETGEKRVMGTQRELPAKRKDGNMFFIELGLIEVKSRYSDDIIFCAFIKDLTSQKVDEARIRSKEKLMSGMIEASFEPMFMIDDEGVVKMVNKAASRVFGWTHDEFVGQNICIIAGEHAKNHDMYIKQYLKTGEAHVMGKKRELVARKKDGSSFLIELGLSEVKMPSGKTYFCGYVRDLTEQKLGEEKLECMIESSFEAMFATNEKGVIQLVNQAASKVFGWSREEFLGSNISMICGKDHGPKHDKYMARYLATGERKVMLKIRELRARRKDGTEFPIELGLTEVKLANNELVFMGFVKDLTQTKIYQQKIERKQQLTEGLINSSFDPMFQINDKGIIELVNQAAVDHFGWTRDEFLGNNISMIAAGKHGRDHDKYIRQYLTTREKKVMGRRRQVMAVRKDGTEWPIELGITEVDTVGEKHFCGYVRDVRRERFDEQELRENEKLTSAIFESLSEALLILDEHGTIYRVNAAATRKLGWTKQEFAGKNLRMMFGTEFAKSCPDIARFIKNTRGREVEIEALKKCGTLHTYFLYLVEVEGPFPILLGSDREKGKSGKGTRVFAAFLRKAEDLVEQKNVSIMDSLMGSIGSLGSEAGSNILGEGNSPRQPQ